MPTPLKLKLRRVPAEAAEPPTLRFPAEFFASRRAKGARLASPAGAGEPGGDGVVLHHRDLIARVEGTLDRVQNRLDRFKDQLDSAYRFPGPDALGVTDPDRPRAA